MMHIGRPLRTRALQPVRRSVEFPSVVWLLANRAFGPLHRLDAGMSREAWLTRDGRVLKLPRRDHSDGYDVTFSTQTAAEGIAMSRGLANGFPMARGELVTIGGIECTLMEYVWPACHEASFYRGADAIHAQADTPTYQRFVRVVGAASKSGWVSRFAALTDGQWGETSDGRIVCYDAGCEDV